MRVLGLLLLAGMLPMRAGALENVSVVSDTVSYFEKAFGVRARLTSWFADGGGSNLRFSFPGKGMASFHLTEPAQGGRHVDKIQVEPVQGALAPETADDYTKRLVADWSRAVSLTCRPLRHDDDGINAFSISACSGAPGTPVVEVTATVQALGGRRLIFVQFAQKK